jgi:hypothetical protein
MKTSLKVIACMTALAVLIVVQSTSAQGSKLEGAWKTVEVDITGPNAVTLTNLQPGLWIFTKNHYSIMQVTSSEPRPELPQQNATDAQRIAAWGPFNAQSGTYEVKGTTFTLHPILDKDPAGMAPGSFSTLDFKIEGKTFTMTTKANQNGPYANPMRVKMVRVE